MTASSARFGITLTQPVNVRLAWLMWGLLLLVACVTTLGSDHRAVTDVYRTAANCWIEGSELYDAGGRGFLYLPQAAIAYVPFSLFPRAVDEFLWRCMTIGLFAVGIWRLAGLARREAGSQLFPLMTIICVPLAWDSARNGQSTLPMAGLMMLAVVDLADSKWWRATMWLSLGLILKPLIVVLILLVVVLHAPMRWRMATGVTLVLLLPFLVQRPDYVAGQYTACLSMLRAANHVGITDYWAQLFGMFKVAGIETPPLLQTVMRVVAGAATLALCWWLKRRRSVVQSHLMLYALSAAYLMLFNPRTENNTYSLFGPALAVFCSQAMLDRRQWVGSYYVACAIAVLSSYEIGRLFVPPIQAVWLAPFGCLAFSIVLIHLAIQEESAEDSGDKRSAGQLRSNAE